MEEEKQEFNKAPEKAMQCRWQPHPKEHPNIYCENWLQ